MGDHGRSFGEWQLFTGGGLGNRALAAGINVRDPKTWREQTKFALNWAIGRRRTVGATGTAPRIPASAGGAAFGVVAPQEGRWTGATYLVGERGPELFTPGASGGITSNRDLARLTDRAAAVARQSAAAVKAPVQHVRGATHYAPTFHLQSQNLAEAKRELAAHFWDLVRQADSDQRGS